MTWTNRVVWQEGMFLRAQHFQQQDRYLEYLVRSRTAALRPHAWGVSDLHIDREMLATGRFAIRTSTGVFEDGTPFAVPGEADHPAPLELPASARNALVFLAVPVRQPGAVEMAADGAPEGRYGLHGIETYDTHSASPQPAELQVGRLRLRYMLETEDRSGYLCLALARVVEVASDRRATLDDRWIPPALACSVSPQLFGFLTELSGMLNQRGDALAVRLNAPDVRGVPDWSDFLLLQCANRWQNLLSHWASSGSVHPEDLYAALVQLAGEMATFTEANRRPNAYPAYRHEDLQRSFAPVMADLRRSLSAVLETSAVAIPLQERRHGVRVGQVTDRSLLQASQFVLMVRADVPAEALRRLFPSQVRIASAERIVELINAALSGVPVRTMPVAPRQILFDAGATYFELDRNGPHWQHIQASGNLAIHVSGDFPGLNLRLWAIRG